MLLYYMIKKAIEEVKKDCSEEINGTSEDDITLNINDYVDAEN